MAGNFNSDWAAFFGEGVKEGTVVDLGNGAKVTKMGDGTAVYQDSTGAWVQYDKNSDPNQVARQATGLAQDWGNTYASQAPISQPFSNVEEFKAWESQNLGGRASIDKFNPNYQAPDYIRQMGAAVGGGDEEAFKRYLFFKNNPQYIEDYAAIHNGQLSKFATDGSTLQRTDMSQLTPEAQAYYSQNPNQLKIAEGFNMDPNLYASRMTGGLNLGKNTNHTAYMQNNRMDANGRVTQSNNAATAAQWAQNNPNYNVNRFDTNTGGLIDGGQLYNPTTGAAMGSYRPATPAGGGVAGGGGGVTPAGGGVTGGGLTVNPPPAGNTPAQPARPSVPVYGPDGTVFPSVQEAIKAGVYNYTYQRPVSGGGLIRSAMTSQ